MSTPITLTVLSTTETNGEKHSSTSFVSPYGNYTLLLKATATKGIELEGMVLSGVSMRFPEAEPYFPNPSGTQTVWASSVTTSTLVNSNLALTIGSKQYTGVRFYRVKFPDGTVQSWYLAPDVGFVQYGEGTYGFKLSSSTVKPWVSQQKTTVASPCALVGIDANPAANGDFSTLGHENRLQQAVTAGSKVIQLNASWAELEPTPGTYNLDKLKTYFGWANKYNLDVVLTIKSVDAYAMAIPADLLGKAMTDPVLQTRFGNLLAAIAPFMNSHVRWVNVANEVDIYYGYRQAEVPAFKSFLNAASARLKALKPSISVGVVFSYDSYRLFEGTFNALAPSIDHVSFTYYSVGDGFIQRSPSTALNDLPAMAAAANGKPLIFTEIGYASAADGGLGTDQRDFVANVFQAASTLGSKITAMVFYQMSDLPPAQIAAHAASYGDSLAFTHFVGSLGFFDASNVPKASWLLFQTNAPKFQQSNYCTREVLLN